MAVILPPRRFLLSATSTEKSLATMALSQPAACGWGEGGPRREHCQSHLNKKTSQNLRHDNMLLLEQETAV